MLLARDEELGRPVAVKLLLRALEDPRSRERFQREARLTAGVEHPHVVTVYDHGLAADGRAWILYEYVEGEDLRQVLRAGSPPVPDVVRWGRQVAFALAAAHEAGAVHRDVKPENVLLRGRGHALLADFGIARRDEGEEGLTADGVILGTPDYMAPEVWTGDPPGPAADQFSWAGCLYELLGGAPPWPDPEVREVLGALREGRALRLPAAVSREQPALAQVVERALALDPGARYPDAAAFAEALARLDTSPSGAAPAVIEEGSQSAATIQVSRDEVAAAGPPARGASPRPESRPRRDVAAHRRRPVPWMAVLGAGLLVAVGLWLARGRLTSQASPPVTAITEPNAGDAPEGREEAARRRLVRDLGHLLAYHGSRELDRDARVPVAYDASEEHLRPRLEALADERLPIAWKRFLESLVAWVEVAGDLPPREPGRPPREQELEELGAFVFHLLDDLKIAQYLGRVTFMRGLGVELFDEGQDRLALLGRWKQNWEELRRVTPEVLAGVEGLGDGLLACRLAALGDLMGAMLDLPDPVGDRFRRSRARLDRSDGCGGARSTLAAMAVHLYPGYHSEAVSCRELVPASEVLVDRFLMRQEALQPWERAELLGRLLLNGLWVPSSCSEAPSPGESVRFEELMRLGEVSARESPDVLHAVLQDGLLHREMDGMLTNMASDFGGLSQELQRLDDLAKRELAEREEAAAGGDGEGAVRAR